MNYFLATLFIFQLFGLSSSQATFVSGDLNISQKNPVLIDSTNNQSIEAKAGIIIDLESDTLIKSKNANKSLPIASITKLVTAYLVIQKSKLSEIVTVGEEVKLIKDQKIPPTIMGLKIGERIKIESLLEGLLIVSANDAAVVLAQYLFGSQKTFVNEMNRWSYLVGLSDTRFVDPDGLSAKNISTATDLSELARIVLFNEDIARIVRIKEKKVLSADGSVSHYLRSTNKLLLEENDVIGLKTGFTEEAGQSIIVAMEKNNHTIIVVLLNSLDRFAEAKKLLDWVFASYQWK